MILKELLQGHRAGRWQSRDSNPPKSAKSEQVCGTRRARWGVSQLGTHPQQGFALFAEINLRLQIIFFKILPPPDVPLHH